MNILKELPDDLTEDDVFVFEVYESPKGTKEIFGMLKPFFVSLGNSQVTWLDTGFGIPVDEAFERVKGMAAQIGMENILISDPKKLFQME